MAEIERLFVALPLPAGITAVLADSQPAARPGVRLIRRDDMHVTLHFIGNAETAQVRHCLEKVRASAVRLEFGAPGHFALRGGRKVLWLGIEPEPALIELHRAVAVALEAVGFEPERRPYVPHVTLARLGAKLPAGLVQEYETGLESVRPDAVDCAAFALFASETAPDGARYQLLDGYALT